MNDSKLVVPLGSTAFLKGLSSEAYNGLEVYISSFDEPSARYIAEIQSESGGLRKLKVKGINLVTPMTRDPELFDICAEINQTQTLTQVLSTMEKVESMEEHIQSNSYARFMNSLCVKALNLSQDDAIVHSIHGKLKDLLNCKILERYLVDVKLSVARCEKFFGNNKMAARILQKLRTRHFGKLPQILRMLAAVNADADWLSYQDMVAMYEEFERVVETGNFKMTKYKDKHGGFNFGDDIRFVMVEYIFLQSEPNLEQVQDIANKIGSSYYQNMIKALIFQHLGEVEVALKHSTLAQQQLTKKYGMNKHLAESMMSRAILFCQQGNFNQGRRVLKKLKKMDCDAEVMEMIQMMEKEIGLMKPRNSSVCKTERVRTLVKCSNPQCERVEEKIGQFQECSNCNVPKYCSRKCQRKHWKNGHKRVCKKSIV